MCPHAMTTTTAAVVSREVRERVILTQNLYQLALFFGYVDIFARHSWWLPSSSIRMPYIHCKRLGSMKYSTSVVEQRVGLLFFTNRGSMRYGGLKSKHYCILHDEKATGSLMINLYRDSQYVFLFIRDQFHIRSGKVK